MATHYIALIHKERESGYGVSFPDVPGVTAVADTLDEAIQEAAVALDFAFEDAHARLPSPRTIEELREDSEFRTASNDAITTLIPYRPVLYPETTDIIYYIYHVYLGYSMKDIANNFNRNCQAILYACHRIEESRESSEIDKFIEIVGEVVKSINSLEKANEFTATPEKIMSTRSNIRRLAS